MKIDEKKNSIHIHEATSTTKNYSRNRFGKGNSSGTVAAAPRSVKQQVPTSPRTRIISSASSPFYFFSTSRLLRFYLAGTGKKYFRPSNYEKSFSADLNVLRKNASLFFISERETRLAITSSIKPTNYRNAASGWQQCVVAGSIIDLIIDH